MNVHLYGGIPFSRAALHQTIAGKLIALEQIQTAAINNAARFLVIRIGYENGSVIAQYLSNEITHKFKMLAVLNKTSSERHISHQSVPKNHVFSSTSYKAENGITTKPTKQSANAKLVTNKFVDATKKKQRKRENKLKWNIRKNK